MNTNALLIFKVLSLLLFICVTANSQNLSSKRYDAFESNLFSRTDVIYIDGTNLANFFPNKVGDFWEFIEEDTTTLFGQFYALKFSVSREVIADTIMSNGLTYKKVKWHNEANSVNYPPEYEYLRVDSIGNAHIFYDTTDYILFDFTLDINQTYPAHLVDHNWKITDKYFVVGFGDTLQAIDFALYDQSNNRIEIYTIVENFGITFYRKDFLNYALPIGSFWGAVINGQEFGTLIVKKQIVDWKEFYPLHIGDYWVYEGEGGGIPNKNTVRVIGDTLMPDGNTYFVSRLIDYHFQYTELNYRRIDSLGKVFYWEYWNNLPVQYFKFSNVVGDTLTTNINNSKFRLDDKYMNPFTGFFELNFFLYPDLAFIQQNYDLGLGLYLTTGDFYLSECVGAYVNGKMVWGDTTLTNLENEINPSISSYKLNQNFPNPFNPSTVISYQLPISGKVILKVFDVLAKEIATLLNEEKPAGNYEVEFQSKLFSREFASGIYFYQLRAGDFIQTKKMILLK